MYFVVFNIEFVSLQYVNLHFTVTIQLHFNNKIWWKWLYYFYFYFNNCFSLLWKESLNSDGQQFHQYHQNKRKFKQWWSTIPSISSKQKKVYTVMVNNSINIIKTKESLNSDGQQFHQYHQNKRKFKQWCSTIPSISSKQKKV